MAESKIIIEIPSSLRQSSVAGPTKAKDDAVGSNQSAGAAYVTNKIEKMIAPAALIAAADSLTRYEIGQVSLRTGASEYQSRLETVYGTARRYALSAGAGFTLGGPVGAIVAIAGTAAGQGLEALKKADELQSKRDLENISIEMQNRRAGTSGRRANQ